MYQQLTAVADSLQSFVNDVHHDLVALGIKHTDLQEFQADCIDFAVEHIRACVAELEELGVSTPLCNLDPVVVGPTGAKRTYLHLLHVELSLAEPRAGIACINLGHAVAALDSLLETFSGRGEWGKEYEDYLLRRSLL